MVTVFRVVEIDLSCAVFGAEVPDMSSLLLVFYVYWHNCG